MISLPSVAEPLLMSFSIAFTEPTFQRSLVLLVGRDPRQGAAYHHEPAVDRGRSGGGRPQRLPPRV